MRNPSLDCATPTPALHDDESSNASPLGPKPSGFFSEILASQETEKDSLARRLHDEVGQLVTVLQLTLTRVRLQPPDRREDGFGELERIARELGRQVHDLAMDLRPAPLGKLGLSGALEDYLDDVSERSQVRVRRSLDTFRPGQLPRETEVGLFRGVQQIVRGLRESGRVRDVFISLAQDGDQIVARVEFDRPEQFGAEAGPRLEDLRRTLIPGRGTVTALPMPDGRLMLQLKAPCRVRREPELETELDQKRQP
ncbi:hypothetical protein DB347_15385 [Opitutaceae bacterium EW11]|nr:hypothetical protein DB347_15385 [Opitutaceae bacterium EW11]